MPVGPLIHRVLPAVVELRHRLHRIPEVQYEEFKTAEVIRQELERLGIPFVAGVPDAPTATIAWLGDPAKPCIALRADIDALPITENTGLEYASTHPGKMHACGHDGHAAGLVGVAGILKSMQDRLPVCVKLIWQPAEEGGAGASRMIAGGVLDGRLGPRVHAIFGLHGWPALKVGTVATRPGPILAGQDTFEVKITGRGCHGAFPHFGHDPIAAAAECVGSLQHIVSREIDPTDSAVVTVAIFHAGTASNVIPDVATFSGTARSLNNATREQLRRAIDRRARGVAAAHECTSSFTWSEGYPPTVNDPAMADYVAEVARATLGADRFVPVGKPSMGAEDFSFYLEKVPGCFFMVGVQPADAASHPSLHSDRFNFTDAALPTAMGMFLELVLRFPVAGK
ncbi:MAG: M20 family metallopeptidase [Tepidisphaerales bacterium]